jgi:hypothetical protein
MSCGPYSAGRFTAGGSTAVRPRFDNPRTAVVRPARALGSRASPNGAKNVEPSGARKDSSVVPNARPTSAADPLTRTSVRFADTDSTRSPPAAAHERTASTVAVVGANCALKAEGVTPPPRAAARSSPARSRGASATVTGTEARDSAPVAVEPLTRTGSSPVVASAAAGAKSAADTATADETTVRRNVTPERAKEPRPLRRDMDGDRGYPL